MSSARSNFDEVVDGMFLAIETNDGFVESQSEDFPAETNA